MNKLKRNVNKSCYIKFKHHTLKVPKAWAKKYIQYTHVRHPYPLEHLQCNHKLETNEETCWIIDNKLK